MMAGDLVVGLLAQFIISGDRPIQQLASMTASIRVCLAGPYLLELRFGFLFGSTTFPFVDYVDGCAVLRAGRDATP